MTDIVLNNRLQATGIRLEQDFAVPVNGHVVNLPYMVVRRKETIDGSDNGRVQILRIEWIVALFTKNRDAALERIISKALRGVGKVEVNRYPDGKPYQTNFEFKTNQIMR